MSLYVVLHALQGIYLGKRLRLHISNQAFENCDGEDAINVPENIEIEDGELELDAEQAEPK